MPRIQILELPEAPGDERAPFALVVDQYEPRAIIVDRQSVDPWRAHRQEVGDRIGAAGVIVTAETVEIPANDVSAEFREGLQSSVAELYESARRSLSESETLGHRLLQRAEQAEAVTAHTKGLLDRRTRTLRERAEQAEAKLRALVEAQHREQLDRMDAITDALRVDRLRDWDRIVELVADMRRNAVQGEYVDGHMFGTYGHVDPVRCSRCKIFRTDWVARRDVPSCDTVLQERERC